MKEVLQMDKNKKRTAVKKKQNIEVPLHWKKFQSFQELYTERDWKEEEKQYRGFYETATELEKGQDTFYTRHWQQRRKKEQHWSEEDFSIVTETRKRRHKPHPKDVLFRTHQYKVTVTPTLQFLNKVGSQCNFYMKTSILKQYAVGSQKLSWKEAIDNEDGKPIVVTSFEENSKQKDVHWKSTVQWVTPKAYDWMKKSLPEQKYKLVIMLFRFHKTKMIFEPLLSFLSTPFMILSKPGVYKKQTKENVIASPVMPESNFKSNEPIYATVSTKRNIPNNKFYNDGDQFNLMPHDFKLSSQEYTSLPLSQKSYFGSPIHSGTLLNTPGTSSMDMFPDMIPPSFGSPLRNSNHSKHASPLIYPPPHHHKRSS